MFSAPREPGTGPSRSDQGPGRLSGGQGRSGRGWRLPSHPLGSVCGSGVSWATSSSGKARRAGGPLVPRSRSPSKGGPCGTASPGAGRSAEGARRRRLKHTAERPSCSRRSDEWLDFLTGPVRLLSSSASVFSEKLSGSMCRGRQPWARRWPAAQSATLGVLGRPGFALSGQARPFLHPCALRGCCGEARLLGGPSVQPGSERIERDQSRLQTA